MNAGDSLPPSAFQHAEALGLQQREGECWGQACWDWLCRGPGLWLSLVAELSQGLKQEGLTEATFTGLAWCVFVRLRILQLARPQVKVATTWLCALGV